MNIPDKAVDTLIDSLGWRIVDSRSGAARKALDAVYPFIAAQALRDASDALDSRHSESIDGGPWDNGFLHASDMVRDRADELDPQ